MKSGRQVSSEDFSGILRFKLLIAVIILIKSYTRDITR